MDSLIFKTSVPNHSEVKKQLLDQINLIPNNPISEQAQQIFHTDWNLPQAMHREYASLFFKVIDKHLTDMVNKMQVERIELSEFWFQRYKQGGIHNWHVHTGVHYANVYYIECPPGTSTQFKHFSVDVKEGDILSFPAFLPHCSPLINEDVTKTIISFNTHLIID